MAASLGLRNDDRLSAGENAGDHSPAGTVTVAGELRIGYGLTEISPGLTRTPRTADLAERTQTVGRVLQELRARAPSR